MLKRAALAFILFGLSGCVFPSIPTPPPTPIPPEPPTIWVPSSVVYSPASTPTPRPTRTPLLMPTPVPPWTPWEMGVPTSTPRPTATPMPTATPQSTVTPAVLCRPFADTYGTPSRVTARDLLAICIDAMELGPVVTVDVVEKCHLLTEVQDSIPHQDIFGACLGGVLAGIPIDDVVEQIGGVDFSIDLNRLSAALRGDDDGNSEQSSSLSGTVTRTATGLVVTFACTGSMEPVITCEHEADAIRITSPDDFGVGDIIVFDSPSDCLGGSIAHRVIAIEVVDDDYSYQTQGDANSIADPCPVPFGAVEYLIENIRLGESNVRKSQLRESVNAAREAHDSARRVLIDAFDETERLSAESSRLADEYNANPTNALFRQWEAAYAAWQTAYSAWEAAKLDYERARATWECWVEAARVNDLDNRAGCSVV